MTQSNESESIYESIKPIKSVNKKLINDKCIQTIAWMLLTIVLCIIGYIIYLSVQSYDAKEIETKVIENRGDLELRDYHSTVKKLVKRERMSNEYLVYENCNAFAMPSYQMSLTLFENRTVKAIIEDPAVYHKFNVIWFYETPSLEEDEDTFDYNCTAYKSPYLFIDVPLKANTTYTFCIMYKYKQTTSPCNCQPLYVPPIRQIIELNDTKLKDDDIKIGFLSLIMIISAFAGAGLGFLSIKTYPELLEGSKNVLVIHKSRNFIGNTESNYLEYTPSSKENRKTTKRQSITSPALFKMDSSWNFYSKSYEMENDYELPHNFNSSLQPQQHSMPNTYAESPSSPPPSPKKNKNISYLGVVNEAFE